MRTAADTIAVSAEPSLAEVRAIVEARFPQVGVERCEMIPGGWDHAMLLVNDEWIFRIPRRPENEATLQKEARLLPELASALPVAVPRFEHVWRGGASPRIIVGYRRIPGVRLSTDAFAGSHAADLSEQMASFLSALHAFPLGRAERVGIPPGGPEAWRREYERFFRWLQREAFPVVGPRERRWASRICEDFVGDAAHFRFAPVLLHRDLEAEHILHDPASGRITGVIDWGDASIGDPAFDFTGLLADLGENVARAVLERYRGPKDAGMVDRARFYANVVPFYGIIYGRQLGHPEWAREGLRRLRALAD